MIDRKPGLVWTGIVALIGLSLSIQARSQEVSTQTPRGIVEKWLQVYPGNLEHAAELTTTAYREGVSQEEWVSRQGPFLKNLGMKYVRAKVVHEEAKGKEAHVMVHAHIVTLRGDHPQDELYILVPNAEGGWLIDAVEVYTETFNRTP